jgi:hypothetical protein
MTISPLPPKTRKLVLTVHVVSSVGWLGTALVILVLVTAALVTADPELRRAAYLVLNLLDSTIVVPVGLAGLISGVLLSLTTHWGLVRHYWVAVKLVLTVVVFDEAVARTAAPGADAGQAGTELLIPGVMALLILTVATVLSTYKPWGRTPVGRRVAAELVRAARSR